MLQLMREGCSYTYPPLSIVRYSFIQLSELEQCRVKKVAHVSNTAAQDSNTGSRNRESEALPLSHYALQLRYHYIIIKISYKTTVNYKFLVYNEDTLRHMYAKLEKQLHNSFFLYKIAELKMYQF